MADQRTRLEELVWEVLIPTPNDAYAAGDGPTPRDVLDAVPDGWAKVSGEWVQVAQADRYDVEGPSGVIDGANVLVTLPKREDG